MKFTTEDVRDEVLAWRETGKVSDRFARIMYCIAGRHVWRRHRFDDPEDAIGGAVLMMISALPQIGDISGAAAYLTTTAKYHTWAVLKKQTAEARHLGE